jgi:hypothetical protein
MSVGEMLEEGQSRKRRKGFGMRLQVNKPGCAVKQHPL